MPWPPDGGWICAASPDQEYNSPADAGEKMVCQARAVPEREDQTVEEMCTGSGLTEGSERGN